MYSYKNVYPIGEDCIMWKKKPVSLVHEEEKDILKTHGVGQQLHKTKRFLVYHS